MRHLLTYVKAGKRPLLSLGIVFSLVNFAKTKNSSPVDNGIVMWGYSAVTRELNCSSRGEGTSCVNTGHPLRTLPRLVLSETSCCGGGRGKLHDNR